MSRRCQVNECHPLYVLSVACQLFKSLLMKLHLCFLVMWKIHCWVFLFTLVSDEIVFIICMCNCMMEADISILSITSVSLLSFISCAICSICVLGNIDNSMSIVLKLFLIWALLFFQLLHLMLESIRSRSVWFMLLITIYSNQIKYSTCAETKNQWARDDPAFAVICSLLLSVCTIAYCAA